MNEDCYKYWDLIIKIVGIIISSLIAIIAIFGEKIKRRFYMPKLKMLLNPIIDFKNGIGITSFSECSNSSNSFSTPPSINYYLTIKNYKLRNIAKNCQILLEGIEKYNENQNIEHYPLIYSLPFKWMPEENTPMMIDIKDEETIHFFSINSFNNLEVNIIFIFHYKNNINPIIIKAKERIRLYLKIKSENFDSRINYIFEIKWNGKYNNDVNIMKQNVIFNQIQ
jgi:hypothetical protein